MRAQKVSEYNTVGRGIMPYGVMGGSSLRDRSRSRSHSPSPVSSFRAAGNNNQNRDL